MSQRMTIGANAVATFEVPSGCTKNNKTRMAQVTPTMVLVEMSGEATFRPGAVCKKEPCGVGCLKP